jgi:hypothetical protein
MIQGKLARKNIVQIGEPTNVKIPEIVSAW